MSNTSAHNVRLSIARLKELVLKALPPSSPLYRVIASEPDELSVEEFIAKLPIWWELAGAEYQREVEQALRAQEN